MPGILGSGPRSACAESRWSGRTGSPRRTGRSPMRIWHGYEREAAQVRGPRPGALGQLGQPVVLGQQTPVGRRCGGSDLPAACCQRSVYGDVMPATIWMARSQTITVAVLLEIPDSSSRHPISRLNAPGRPPPTSRPAARRVGVQPTLCGPRNGPGTGRNLDVPAPFGWRPRQLGRGKQRNPVWVARFTPCLRLGVVEAGGPDIPSALEDWARRSPG